ncbi:nucleolar pre-ribosomal-associated protein 1 [Trichomycterus rosablanca]|uniref:nucleolar pre-ribosomal-associated protein 1 n=1 Tax=Trichomycterus rosablanca TaxID=2290929 RepID=UPI002F3588BF
MANKRQNKDLNVPVQQKKYKSDKSEFNGTIFKSMLKDPSKTFKGLENFIQTAKKLPGADLYDVVEGYIKISAECAEILSLLDGASNSEAELMLIFQSLELILLRTASDLSHLSLVGSTIVKKTVSSHMKLLQSTLSSKNHQVVRRCLCLLTAMVSQGTDAANDVLTNFVFSKTLSNLARLRDKAGRPDVRTAYVQFALSFLMYGDGSSLGHILDTRDFLSGFLNTGLKEDRLSVISLILSTLQTKVVQNSAVSKTQKLRFFTASTLTQIASLYKWNGIVDATTDHTEGVNEQEGGKLAVRELVHNFLLEVCCSRKNGISFHDPSLGTAGRTGNIVLLQFAVSLKQAMEDELVAELLVSILKCNPDILRRYFKETQFSFAPRMKATWLESITLLKKIYQAQPEVSSAVQSQEMIPASRLLSMVQVTSLPPVCNKTFFTQGLNLPGVGGQHATLSLLAFILKRAQKNIEHCLKRSSDSCDTGSLSSMEDFVQLYREALSKILPDVMSIVSKWQSLSKKKNDTVDSKSVSVEPKGEYQVMSEDHGERDPKLILFKALLLQVICLYQRVVPHLVTESKFDFSKLLKGIVSAKATNEDVPPVLQYQILQLALELPASKFSWFHLQDAGALEQEGVERSVLYVLLKMFVNSSSTHLRTSTRMLILKVLRESGVFEHTWREFGFWLDHLLDLESSQQQTAIQFLDQVLVRVVCNPYVYIDKVSAMQQEAVSLQAERKKQDMNADDGLKSHADDIPGDFIIKAGGGATTFKDIEPSQSEDLIPQIFPFSPAVPAILEARNKHLLNLRDQKDVLCEYICAVLCDVLHCQRDPLAMCLTLQHYDEEILLAENSTSVPSSLTAFHHYYCKWISEKSQILKVSLVQSSVPPLALGFPALLKSCYTEGPTAFLRDSFRQDLETSLSTLQLSRFTGAVSQTLIYLKTFVETFSSLPKGQALEVVGRVLEVLHALLLKLHSTTEIPSTQPELEENEELLMEMNLTAVQEVSREQVLLAVFRSVFTHPVLKQWFLAVELGGKPSQSLKPERMRQLCDRLTVGVLTLLQSCAETLQAIHALKLISPYLSAAQHALLTELQRSSRCPTEESQSVKAFLALHQYMEPSSVNEVLSALLMLPQNRLLADGDQLSVYGHAVLTILTKAVSHTFPKNGLPFLSHVHFRSLASLYPSCHSAQLEDFLLQVLRNEPGFAKVIPTDILLHCLQCRCSPELTALLVQVCSTHCLSFELWCLEQTDLTHITAENGGFRSLLVSYLQRVTAEDPCRPKDIQKTVLKMLTKRLLAELSSSVLRVKPGVSLEQSVDLISRLIQLGAVDPDRTKLISDLPVLLQKTEHPESKCLLFRWHLADSITQKLGGTQGELQWRKSLLTAALRWLSATYKEQKEPCVETEEAMLQRLKTLQISSENVTDQDWNTFIKSGLKYRYQDVRFLCTLNSLLGLMYSDVKAAQGLLTVQMIHTMVTSHSLFLPTMLTPNDEAKGSHESKEALVSLLLTLVRKCPEVCNSNHFHVLLGAYGATLSPTDRKLVLLLKEYEKQNISLVEFQCLLWGSAAVEYHKTRKSLGPTLWQQLGSEQLLDQLSIDIMINTVKHFPQHFCLVPKDEDLISIENKDGSQDELSLYDPSFLISLFSYILRPESVIDCRKFVSSHALGVTVAALSSYDHKMRAAAYHVLGSFYQHLEGARFKEKKQLLYLLDTVRNGIQKQNLRVSFLHATYIAKVAQLILRPEEHMYLVVNRFLLGTPYMDLKRLPDFFRLFYSFDLEHKLEREWVLKVLEDGMRDRISYDLCEQQTFLQILLGFCSSPLCDQSSQIINVLRKIAHINEAASDFIKEHGILTWIGQLLQRRHLDGRLLSPVINLLHTLWFTNLDKKGSRTSWSNTADVKPKRHKWLPFSVTNNYLGALLTVIKHLRTGVAAADVRRFLQTLESVLKHHAVAPGGQTDADRLTPNPQTLTCSAALGLLHVWGRLACDDTLLDGLQELASKHNVKALLGSGNENLHGNVKCGVEKDVMLACKTLLVNVFTHWEPWPAPCIPNQNADNPTDSTGLINATAYTLINWTLRTLSEMPYDENDTLATLKWLKTTVVHESIARSLLTGEAVRADLLRLYDQACEGQSTVNLDIVQLFTSIMVHLLEAQGTDLHTSVINTCSQTTTDDDHREAGLKLLSWYIYDVWNGAQVPRLLLSHAQLLSKYRKNHKNCRSPVVHICEDILPAFDSSVLF